MTESPASSSKFALTRVQITGYRGFEHVEFALGPMNVLVGINGSGKTTILRAMSAILNSNIGSLLDDRDIVDAPTIDDFRDGRNTIRFEAWISDSFDGSGQASDLSWTLAGGEVVQQKAEFLSSESGQMKISMKLGQPVPLPLVCSYRAGQPIGAPDLMTTISADSARPKGYQGAFGVRDFSSFFQWFRDQEDAENEERLNRSTDYRHPQLSAVRRAVELALPGYEGLRVQRRPRLRLVMSKGKQATSFQQMSDGEKGVITLVGDIARRACLLNPQLPDPLNAPGIILIDEIEQHLHPQWQRHLIQSLPTIFPNLQFIIATHSPIVCNSVRPTELLILKDGLVSSASAFGWSVEDVLRSIFGLDDRPAEVNKQLLELDKALDAGEAVESQRLVEELEKILPSTDQELLRAKVILPFLQQAETDEKP